MQPEPTHRRDLRLSLAAADTPVILVWAGALVVVLSSVAFVLNRDGGLDAHAADLAVGVLFVVCGFALSRLKAPKRLVPWIFAMLVTILIFAFLFEIWRLPSAVSMAYVLVVMCAFGPATLAWRPFALAAVVTLVGSGLTAITWAGDTWGDWTLAALTALLIGALLLRTRLSSVGALADATATIQRLATTDELTGALNRHGITMAFESLAAHAQRRGQPVFVAFVDIDGLKGANDEFGHEFGDAVIETVTASVRATVRLTDLVAQWGGDELVIAGLGIAPDVATFTARLHANIVASGIDLNRWSGSVSVGMAEGNPAESSMDSLISSADSDMYQRRLDR